MKPLFLKIAKIMGLVFIVLPISLIVVGIGFNKIWEMNTTRSYACDGHIQDVYPEPQFTTKPSPARFFFRYKKYLFKAESTAKGGHGFDIDGNVRAELFALNPYTNKTVNFIEALENPNEIHFSEFYESGNSRLNGAYYKQSRHVEFEIFSEKDASENNRDKRFRTRFFGYCKVAK